MASIQETLDLLKSAKNKYARNAGKTIQLKEGKTRVRILNNPADPQFWRDAGQYWIKADEKGKPLAVPGSKAICYGTDDEVADAIEAAILSAGNDEELKLYKSWRARKFVLCNALIFDGPDAGPKPQILQLTPSLFSDYLSVMETYTESGVDVFDPASGIDVIFEKRGKMLDTEYSVMAAPVSKPFNPELMKELNDLTAFVEKEYFREGDIRKGLTAITSVTGISFSALALPAPAAAAAGRVGALTGSAAKLAELSATVDPAVEVAKAAELAAANAAKAAAAAKAKADAAEAAELAAAQAAAAQAAAAKPAIETAVIEEVAEDDDEAELKALLAAQAAKKAAKVAAAAAAAQAAETIAKVAPAAVETAKPAPAANADGFGGNLDMDDLEKTLAELDNL